MTLETILRTRGSMGVMRWCGSSRLRVIGGSLACASMLKSAGGANIVVNDSGTNIQNGRARQHHRGAPWLRLAAVRR
jgi:hypothetical protein